MGIGLVSLFFLGYWRANFYLAFDRFFGAATGVSPPGLPAKYPTSLSGIGWAVLHSSSWLASLVYTALFAFHAAGLVWGMYGDRKWVTLTLWIYFALAALCFLLILGGNALKSYTLGYGLSQHVKHLLQSPFFAIVLLAAFRLIRKND